RSELEALQARFEAEVARLKAELGEKLEALDLPKALPAPGKTSSPSPKDRPVYVISVAAELVEMHPQTLRLYERKGLIKPRRSGGKTRLYSERDIERLREIRRLTQELGVNLAGVEEIMRLRSELEALQARFEAEVARLKLLLLEKAKEVGGV
ncbi:MAG: heat shock protein transcriptional repressor HspR, partial [Thermaceae bacterium]